MVRAISGRPARCLANGFTALAEQVDCRDIPAYPIAYDAGKALNAAAKAAGEPGFGAQWAGQGAPLAQALPVAAIIAKLADELARRHPLALLRHRRSAAAILRNPPKPPEVERREPINLPERGRD